MRGTFRVFAWTVGFAICGWTAAPGQVEAGSLTFTYFGAAGWRIASDSVVVLLDPYLSRLNYSGSPSEDPADTRPVYRRSDTLIQDTAVINRHIDRADYILVQHAHPDHVLDVPYIARRTGAVVIGHETTINIMKAYGVPDGQLITVRGGEDYDFGAFSVRVIPSLHSPLNDKRYYQSRLVGPDQMRPLRISDLVEGGSLMYLIRLAGQRVLTMGSMNFIEREVAGLAPDIALIGAAPSHLEIYDYTNRLMRLLDYPPVVFPTHADNFSSPYGSALATLRAPWIDTFRDEMRIASPSTRLIIQEHLVPVRVLARRR